MKRRKCKTCKGTGKVANSKQKETWFDSKKGITSNLSGMTCKRCHGTGYVG